jgi:2-keto-4-pentenoate hydratase/2-oxohepta-3-ene-1,7-dioic acid hydratase in catechol pathway
VIRPSKIVCVGRNYLAHARELGNDVPTEPLIFFKPPSTLISAGDPILRPAISERVDFEGEIGVVIGEDAFDLAERDARAVIRGLVAANDVTARDLQNSDAQWTRAKGYDSFCPISEEVSVDGIDLGALTVTTRVNDEVRQEGHSSDMAFSIPFIVAYVSRIMTLKAGDLILTGTPEGVGPLLDGDTVEVIVTGGVRATVKNVVKDRIETVHA